MYILQLALPMTYTIIAQLQKEGNMDFGIKQNNLVYCKRRDNKKWTIQRHRSQDKDLRQSKPRTQPKSGGEPMWSRRESSSCFGKNRVCDIWKKKYL